MPIETLDEAIGAIAAARQSAEESGQKLAEAVTNAETARAAMTTADEELEAAATELADALEKLGESTGQVSEAQTWLTEFAAKLASGLPAGNTVVEGLRQAAEAAGEVIGQIELYGSKVGETQGQSEQVLEDTEAVKNSADDLIMGVGEGQTLNAGLLTALDELTTQLGNLE
jgi:ABC-type transporter Mla subunit MlaD